MERGTRSRGGYENEFGSVLFVPGFCPGHFNRSPRRSRTRVILTSMYLSSAGSPELAQAANALDMAARDHLKGLRDWSFDCLLACTFAVGIGLLMELPEIVHDICEIYGRESRELKYWLTPSIDRKEYPRRDWVKKWAALGWVLIVLGVMGEGWFEEQVSKYDSALSNMTDAVVAKAEKDSADAEATARGFDAQIADSNAKAKSAEATAKGFEAQISDAKARAAEAELELARLKTPRTLSKEQLERISSRVKRFGGTPFDLWISSDSDSASLLVLIDPMLRAAGWKFENTWRIDVIWTK